MQWHLKEGEEVTIVGHLETVCVKMTRFGNLEMVYRLPRSGTTKTWCPGENRDDFNVTELKCQKGKK